MENRDFIITSLQPWDIEIGSTIKNTAVEISRHNRVFYINTPPDRNVVRNPDAAANAHRIAALRGQVPLVRQINERMWVIDCPFTMLPVGQLPTAWLFNAANWLNNRRLGRYIVEAVKPFDVANFIHIIDTDLYRSRYLKQFIHPAVSVYYCRDYVVYSDYWRKHGKRVEDELAASADVVLTNSTYFRQRFLPINRNAHAIETGVNLELYDATRQLPIPGDVASITRPIIGYVGALTALRLDIGLLVELAQRCPAMSFVFVGPEDQVFASSQLHSMGNVHFLGSKEVEQLPAYINAFDVCINPQLINDMTIGNYPLKADEYLAMGKPMVATATHTMQDVFGRHTHLATDADSYEAALRQALTEVGDQRLRQERIAFAHTHSWGHSVAKIYRIIEDYEASNAAE